MHHPKIATPIGAIEAAVRAAMKKRKQKKHQLAEKLKISPIMVDKLLWGDVFPSRHLKKQMTEVLGIKKQRVSELVRRREHKTPRNRARAKRPEIFQFTNNSQNQRYHDTLAYTCV